MRKLIFILALAFGSVHILAPSIMATVAEDDAADRYVANGTATTFAYNFKILTSGDIEVLVNGVVKVLGTDYLLSGVGASNGGTVIFNSAPANLAEVTLLRRQPIAQGTNYLANSAYRPLTTMQDLDKLAMIDQMLAERISRAFSYPKGITPTQGLTEIPEPTEGGKCLGRNDANTANEWRDCEGGGGGGSGLPGGTDTQVQFNDAGVLGGDPGLTFNKTTNVLTASGGFVGPLTGAVSGNASTATALAANGANCIANNAPLGMDASGAAEGCFPVVSQALLDAHLNDTTNAHLASAIGVTPVGALVATNAQSAFAELDSDLTAHLNDTIDAHDASAISFSPVGDIEATDVQEAIAELDNEKLSAEADTLSTAHGRGNFVVANTLGTALEVRDDAAGTNKCGWFWDPTDGFALRCTPETNRNFVIPTDKTGCNLYSQEHATCVGVTTDPDNASEDDKYDFAAGYRPFVYTWEIRTGAPLADTDDRPDIFFNLSNQKLVVTNIHAKVTQGTGTSTVNIQRNDGTAADICTADIVASTTGVKCTASSTIVTGEATLSPDQFWGIDVVTAATSGTPEAVKITISGYWK